MIRSSDELIRDIWSRINGSQMLELRFDRLKNLLIDLGKSIAAETRTYAPCKSKVRFIIHVLINQSSVQGVQGRLLSSKTGTGHN